MDKRFFLALLLTAIVIIAPPLFLQRGGVQRATSGIDTSHAPNRADTASKQATASSVAAATQNGGGAVVQTQNAPAVEAAVETTTVDTRLARYGFTSQGAVPISVALEGFDGVCRAARIITAR